MAPDLIKEVVGEAELHFTRRITGALNLSLLLYYSQA